MRDQNLTVRVAGDDAIEFWDAFVHENAGTYCHLFGWRQVLASAYGLRCHYLTVSRGDDLLAVIPLAETPRLPWGARQVVSLPYCNYGGMVARPGEDKDMLLDAVLRHLATLDIPRLELRDVAPGFAHTVEVSMKLVLPGSEEELWRSVGDKVRNQVRKATRAGLELRWGRDQGQELYGIYSANMGRLGSPVHSRRFVLGILDVFREQTDILTVRLAGKAIGAMLVLRHQDIWIDPVASCLAEFNPLSPAMLLYWEALRQACAAKAGAFDLGRSRKGSGTHRFKRQWGAREVPLHYHSYVAGRPVAEASTDFYRSPRASLAAHLWAWLPSVVHNRLGPVVRRWVP